MNELTIILFIVAMGLFVIGVVTRKEPIHWLSFFVSMCSIGQTLTDATLTDTEQLIMIVSVFYVFLMSGWSAFMRRDG